MTGGENRSGLRTVIGNISLSLDGRTSGPNGQYDMGWIVPHAITDTTRNNLISLIKPATTALMGRKNYQGFGGYWPSVANDESADPRDREFSRWLNAVEKIVFSTTITEATWQNSRIVNSDPAAFIRELRQQPGGDILVLSSGSVIKTLLKADVLDCLSITLCPEIAGGGARLFENANESENGLSPSSWRLLQSTPSESGALCLRYGRKTNA